MLRGSQAVEIANDVGGNAGAARLARRGSLTCLGSDHGEFAGIKPVSSAVWALVHFNAAFRAEEVPMELHVRAAGTFAFVGVVQDQALVALDVQQWFSGSLILFVNLLEFEGIEPDPTAATLADIYGNASDLGLGQLVETDWAFHDLELACITSHASHRFATGMCRRWEGQ